MEAATGGLVALERPLRTAAPPWWRRWTLPAALGYVGLLVAVAWMRGDIASALPAAMMVGGMVGLAGTVELEPMEMDGRGIRGGDSGDRMTWPFIERIDMADASLWHPYARVIGRYGNEIRIHAQLTAPGFTEHPATLVRREAEARDIEVRGHRPVAPLHLRAAVVLLYVMAGVTVVIVTGP